MYRKQTTWTDSDFIYICVFGSVCFVLYMSSENNHTKDVYTQVDVASYCNTTMYSQI